MNMTLEQYVALRDALIEAPPNAMGSVTVGGHTVTWASLKDFREMLAFYERMIVTLRRTASGQGRIGMSLANFQSRQ